jgi:hypothetical protein
VPQSRCLRVLGRLDPVHRRHRPSGRDRVRDLCQRCSEPAGRRSRNRQGLRLRHCERREHVHRESSESCRQHLRGEQRSNGRLLRSGVRIECCRVGRRPPGRPYSTIARATRGLAAPTASRTRNRRPEGAGVGANRNRARKVEHAEHAPPAVEMRGAEDGVGATF